MKQYLYSLKSMLGAFTICLAFLSCDRAQESLPSYGPIKVGGSLPQYAGVSQNGTEIGPTTPSGKFFIHFISHDLPPSCLDAECGDEGQFVKEQGGHLIGGSDGKLAKLFGVRIIQGKPYQFDTSLIVVSNEKGIVKSIHKNGQREQLIALAEDLVAETKHRTMR